MASLGGFLAVSYLAERVFTDALDAAWRENWRDASAIAPWSADTPFGRVDATGGLSIDKPALAFRGATNRADVHLTGAGRYQLRLAGVAVGGVVAMIDARASVPVRVTQEVAFKKAVVDLSAMTLQANQIRLSWFEGPGVPDAQTALLSDAARAALMAELRRRATNYLTFRLPTDQVWAAEIALMTKGIPGSLIVTPQIKLGDARILDGWMAVGIDATSSIGATRGDASQIGPPPDAPPLGTAAMPQNDPGTGRLRLIIDPALALTYLQANARLALRFAVASRPNLHPNFDGIRVAFEADTITVHVDGSVDAPDPFPGAMPFTADVRIRPFIPKNAHTVYASIKPDVRVDAPWYLDVLGAMLEFFGGDPFAALRRANKSQMAILFPVKIRRSPPNPSALSAGVEGRQLAIRPDLLGIYAEADVSTSFSEPDLSPTPTVRSRIGIRDRFLRLTPANERLSVDPTFRVRYRIRRASNGSEVGSGVEWSGSRDAFGPTIDLWDDANVLETAFTIELTAERPPGTEVGRAVQSVDVVDPFDRSHPFVRWNKKHYFTGGLEPKLILSAIHKTAIRERCKFCDTREGRFNTPYSLQALDSLPAPEEDDLSSRLCGYCFPNG